MENKLGVPRADGVTFPGWPSTADFSGLLYGLTLP